jgi:hypothetical protein
MVTTSTTAVVTPQSRNGSSKGNILTRTKLFSNLTKWSFEQCDLNHTQHINRDELYTGILLVHLQLAKYAGVAACYPPSRNAINKLFDASDHNQSGYIEEMEFTNIMIVACTQITSRIFVYYTIIVISVPYITGQLIRTLLNVDQYLGFQNDIQWLESILTYGKIVETTLSFLVFFILVPYIFDFIDSYFRHQAASSSASTSVVNAATTTTATMTASNTNTVLNQTNTPAIVHNQKSQ